MCALLVQKANYLLFGLPEAVQCLECRRAIIFTLLIFSLWYFTLTNWSVTQRKLQKVCLQYRVLAKKPLWVKWPSQNTFGSFHVLQQPRNFVSLCNTSPGGDKALSTTTFLFQYTASHCWCFNSNTFLAWASNCTDCVTISAYKILYLEFIWKK